MKRTPAAKFAPHLQFVTARTSRRIRLFLHDALCRAFLAALSQLRRDHPFQLFAYVLMPDHVHLLVRPFDGRISGLMQKIKSLSARRLIESLKASGNSGLLAALKKSSPGRKQHVYQTWQDGFHAVPLWSAWMIRKKIDYMHANPLRKGLVKSARDYPWSSFTTFHGLGRGKISLDPIPN